MELEAGAFAGGRLLPGEAELSSTYSASRVTIRKALEVLRAEGRVDARQGFGWFVAGETVRQPLARLGTLEEQLSRLGRPPSDASPSSPSCGRRPESAGCSAWTRCCASAG